jgi:hypothetical protein
MAARILRLKILYDEIRRLAVSLKKASHKFGKNTK